MRFRIRSLIPRVLLSAFFVSGSAWALAQTTWQRVVPMSGGMGLRDIAANADRFVGVGRAGLVITSTDGLNWTDRDAGTYESLTQIKPFAGGFIVAGEAGSLFQSADGLSWHHRLAGVAAYTLTVGSSRAIVLTRDQEYAVYHSEDGQTWTHRPIPFDPVELTFVADRFFCSSAEGPMQTSRDGLNWLSITLPPATPTPQQLRLPVHNGAVFFSYQGYGSDGVFLSADGQTWSRSSLPFLINSLHVVDGVFFANLNDGNGPMYRSMDGVSWSSLPAAERPVIPSPTVQRGNVTLSRYSAIHRSEGGSEFTPVVLAGNARVADLNASAAVAHARGRWVTTEGYYSTDGMDWAPVDPAGPLGNPFTQNRTNTVSAAHERFFVISTQLSSVPSRSLWGSDDGVQFTLLTELPDAVQDRVTYANGYFLLPELTTGAVFRSTDGSTWTRFAQALPVSPDFNGQPIPVELAQRQFVSLGDRFLLHVNNSGFYTSPDGLVWTALSSHLDARLPLRELRAHAGRLVAVGTGDIWESTDAISWSKPLDVPLTSVDDAIHTGTHLMVIGRDFYTNALRFAATRDARGIWTRSLLATDGNPRGLAVGEDRTLVAIGGSLWSATPSAGPEVVSSKPKNISILTNQSPDVAVEVNSPRPLTYQWARRGQNIVGATQPTLDPTLLSPTSGNREAFVLKISDGTHVTSVVYHLSIASAIAPHRTNSSGMYTRVIGNSHGGLNLSLAPAFQGPNLTFRWKKNGIEIPGDSYVLSVPVNAYTVGDRYQLIATNAAGSAMSETVTLAWPEIEASEITKIYTGSHPSTVIGVTASGAWGFQWRLNGVALPGAHQSNLDLSTLSGTPPSTNAPADYYDVLIFNDRQTIRRGPYPVARSHGASLPTTLPEYPFSPLSPPHLSNLSVRAMTQPGEETLTAGFVIASDAIRNVSQGQKILVRGIGPGLAAYGVSPTLTDPHLQLRTTTDAVLAENTHWHDGGTELTATFAAVGAFALTPASADAALVYEVGASPSPIVLTAPVTDASDGSGEVLVEVYAMPDGNGSHLSNLSARGAVAPDNPLTAGFVIDGAGTVPLIIRAVGPGLEDFGVEHAAPAPRLTVFNAAGEVVASSGAVYPDIVAESETALGAFPLRIGSPNAAVFLNLPPGAYTAQVQDDVGGLVLLELYLNHWEIVIGIPIDDIIVVPAD